MTSKALTVQERGGAVGFTVEQMDAMKEQFGRDLTPAQFSFAIEFAKASGLNPLLKQVHYVVRPRRDGPATMAIQIGIDGYRIIAQRSGLYAGQDGPYWCGKDGVWKDVWLEDGPPMAAKVGVLRRGSAGYTYHVAKYSEYVQTAPVWEKRNGQNVKTGTAPTEMWVKMPANQLAKCAEAGAIRKEFGNEIADLLDRSSEPVDLGYGEEFPESAVKTAMARTAKRPIERPRPLRERLDPPEGVDEETGEISDEDGGDEELETVEGEVLSREEAAAESASASFEPETQSTHTERSVEGEKSKPPAWTAQVAKQVAETQGKTMADVFTALELGQPWTAKRVTEWGLAMQADGMDPLYELIERLGGAA